MLDILQVGEDMASSRYVHNKIKDCEEIGIIACERVLHDDVTTVGKPKFLNCYPIHIPVIDVGINFIEAKMEKCIWLEIVATQKIEMLHQFQEE